MCPDWQANILQREEMNILDLWRKVRKRPAPPEQIHQVKTQYNRRRDKKSYEVADGEL